MTANPSPDLPLLAVAYGDRSVPMFQLLEATSAICRVLWIVDGTEPESHGIVRPLSRFGAVVDIAGLPVTEAARLVREHRPDGIIAYRERDLSLVASLAEQLGLQYHEPIVARRLVDKLYQRRALADGGLPTPSVVEVDITDDPSLVDEIAAQVVFPVMVKPRRGNGSSYVFKAGDPQELAAIFSRCASWSNQDHEFIVEEFLEDLPELSQAGFASFVSVETVLVDGEIHHIATNGRLPLADPFRETGTFIPSELDAEQTSSVLTVATDAIRALGVRNGCLHTEIKLTPNGPRVLEVNGRVGGGVADMLKLACGLDVVALSVRVALGLPIDLEDMVACPRVGYRFLYQPPVSAHVVATIEGLDRVSELPGIHRVYLQHGPGNEFDAADGSVAYLFDTVGSVSDHDALLAVVRTIRDTVSVTYGKRAS
ncbi:MAG: ATP-grasp domain-containing protein [Acidimicrobiales bacterium]